VSELVLVNKKMLMGGLAMVIVGTILSVTISATMPAGQTGMTQRLKFH